MGDPHSLQRTHSYEKTGYIPFFGPQTPFIIIHIRVTVYYIIITLFYFYF